MTRKPTSHCRIPHVHRVGINRREIIQVGFLGALGMTTSGLLAQQALAQTPPRAARAPKAKAVILVWLPGGPPHMQYWDLKPDSPSQCKGTAQAIKTSAPGITLGHWLPKLAKQAHRFALLRSLTLNAEDDNHNLGHHKVLSAVDFRPRGSNSFQSRNDWPAMGTIVSALKPSKNGMPSDINLPVRILDGGKPCPGEGAGFLGSKHDPWLIQGDPNKADFHVPDLMPMPGLTVDRINNRFRLLAGVDARRRDLDGDAGIRQLANVNQRAYQIATAPATRLAFDLSQEPTPLRDRYGRHTFGQSMLLARRLVETGVPFVQVNLGGLNTWDSHRHEDQYLERLSPPFDQGFSALLEDLHQRGMLEETLVMALTEMGRNPVLGKAVAGAAMNASDPDGRNHWQWCWTVMFAGAGVRGGTVVGKSDDVGGHPDGDAYYPSDIGATVYSAMGINPRHELLDREERPFIVNDGEVISGLF